MQNARTSSHTRRNMWYHGCMKKRDSENLTPMDAALRFLGYRARSVREVERHLDEKQFGEYEIMQTVERLHELGLLDDAKFAADFVESRLRTKPVSKRHLREQLFSHELPGEIIETVLDGIPDEEERTNATQIAGKYWRQLDRLPKREREDRVMQRLIGRGYSYETARFAVTAVAEDGELFE